MERLLWLVRGNQNKCVIIVQLIKVYSCFINLFIIILSYPPLTQSCWKLHIQVKLEQDPLGRNLLESIPFFRSFHCNASNTCRFYSYLGFIRLWKFHPGILPGAHLLYISGPPPLVLQVCWNMRPRPITNPTWFSSGKELSGKQTGFIFVFLFVDILPQVEWLNGLNFISAISSATFSSVKLNLEYF